MYLFSRRTRLAPGHGTKGIEWAVAMCERVNQSTDLDLSLWANVYSAGWGTISWTAFLPDLTMLEAAGDKLQADSGYLAATDEGAAFTMGGSDDSLLEVLYGTPDPDRNAQYVTGVQAVCASGGIAKGVTVGIELAQRGEAITGVPTMFVRSVTGPYSGVGWLTGHTSISELEDSQRALAADADWVTYIDTAVQGVYVDDASVTQSTIYRKIA